MHKKPTDQPPAVESPSGVPTSIVQPIIDHLNKPVNKPPSNEPTDEKAPPIGPIHPPKPAELDQDPGGAYDPSHVIPQP